LLWGRLAGGFKRLKTEERKIQEKKDKNAGENANL